MFYRSTEDLDTVEAAHTICEKKIHHDCAPPEDSVHLHKASKAELSLNHSIRFVDALRPIKRILREHATVLATKKALLG